jgi:hypothetical protein
MSDGQMNSERSVLVTWDRTWAVCVESGGHDAPHVRTVDCGCYGCAGHRELLAVTEAEYLSMHQTSFT